MATLWKNWFASCSFAEKVTGDFRKGWFRFRKFINFHNFIRLIFPIRKFVESISYRALIKKSVSNYGWKIPINIIYLEDGKNGNLYNSILEILIGKRDKWIKRRMKNLFGNRKHQIKNIIFITTFKGKRIHLKFNNL